MSELQASFNKKQTAAGRAEVQEQMEELQSSYDAAVAYLGTLGKEETAFIKSMKLLVEFAALEDILAKVQEESNKGVENFKQYEALLEKQRLSGVVEKLQADLVITKRKQQTLQKAIEGLFSKRTVGLKLLGQLLDALAKACEAVGDSFDRGWADLFKPETAEEAVVKAVEQVLGTFKATLDKITKAEGSRKAALLDLLIQLAQVLAQQGSLVERAQPEQVYEAIAELNALEEKQREGSPGLNELLDGLAKACKAIGDSFDSGQADLFKPGTVKEAVVEGVKQALGIFNATLDKITTAEGPLKADLLDLLIQLARALAQQVSLVIIAQSERVGVAIAALNAQNGAYKAALEYGKEQRGSLGAFTQEMELLTQVRDLQKAGVPEPTLAEVERPEAAGGSGAAAGNFAPPPPMPPRRWRRRRCAAAETCREWVRFRWRRLWAPFSGRLASTEF